VLFLLLCISKLPGVERLVLFVCYNITFLTACIVDRTQNLLYIIQRRSTQHAFSFVIYQSTAYWSGAYPKFTIYHPTPNISFNCLLEWSVPKIYYVSSNADRLDVLFLLLCISKLPGVERLALFICYNISLNCL
jgi:hypothetical protein